jgi:hypothetical protein
MKALLTILAVALIAWAVMPATSSAQTPEVTVYMDDPGAPGSWSTYWLPNDPNALARLFRLGTPIDSSCNKRNWYIDFEIFASVAQWVEWSLDHQGWYWFIKKPGCYAGDCIAFNIASNGDIHFTFNGFNNLQAVTPNMHDEEIDAWYSYGDIITDAEANGWTSALNLANLGVDLDETTLNGDGVTSPNLHFGMSYKLWTKVCVERCNTACEYYNAGQIIITLDQQKEWLDDNGDWINTALAARLQ